jgi:hypothetical protein
MKVELRVVIETVEARERLDDAIEVLSMLAAEYPWMPAVQDALDHLHFVRKHLSVHELPGDRGPPEPV